MSAKLEAVQFVRGNFDEIETFVGGDAEFRDGRLVVAAPQGALRVAEGQWIVRYPTGEFAVMETGTDPAWLVPPCCD